MVDETPSIWLEPKDPGPAAANAAEFLRRVGPEHAPTGIFHWSSIAPYRIADFDGVDPSAVCDQPTWSQLHLELHAGSRVAGALPPPDAVDATRAEHHARGEVPIAVVDVRYDTPTRSYAAQALSGARPEEPIPEPDLSRPEELLEERAAFFASPLLPDRSHAFELLPHVHHGLTVRFVVPRDLYLGSASPPSGDLEVDFDDGHGARGVGFDQVVEVTYADEQPKHIQLRVQTAAGPRLATSLFEVARPTAPPVSDEWPLTGVRDYAGQTASGTAWVFYGAGHTSLVNPVIFADGFGLGATVLDEVWRRLDDQSFATTLLNRGKDLVILGYHDRTTHIQANAFVAVACIEEVLSKRQGTAGLVVGGASMGGLVTRYALAWMEAQGRDAQAATYLSFDTPHDGAWVPPILQYFAYYFEDADPSYQAKLMANLLRSTAARQLLWRWVPTWDYQGPFTDTELRRTLYNELGDYGWFPSRPRTYGVANGTGNGTGNSARAGANAFDWSGGLAGARPNIEPEPGDRRYLGDMWLLIHHTAYYATNVQALDGAPGGTTDFFGQAGDAARNSGHGSTTINYRTTCFVPTVSALSTQEMGTPYVTPEGSDLDEYTTCTANYPHVTMTADTARWILERVAPGPTPTKPPIKASIVWSDDAAYFFRGNEYYLYLIKEDQVADRYPRPIAPNWPRWPSGWDGVDAGIMWPSGNAYFFRGDEYVLFDVKNNRVPDGYPKPIAPYWPRWPSGWDRVDAAIMWPNGNAYLFRDDEYVLFDVKNNRVPDGYPKPIAPYWPGLWPGGVDSAVMWPNGYAYFFRGDEYMRYDIQKDRVNDRYPKLIASYWPGL